MAEAKKRNKVSALACFVLFVIIACVIAHGVWQYVVAPKVEKNSYQAVFLEGNQQYFGHLHNITTRYPYLTDIYYVRQDGVSDPQNPANNKFTLFKLGTEIHGPKDEMYLNKSKILFWENLRDDSQVVQGIAKEKAQRASGVVTPQAEQPAPVAAPAPAPAAKPAK